MKSVFVFLALFVILIANAQEEKISTKVYFDVEIGGTPAGRIVMGLFGDDVPRTVGKFNIYY